MNFAPHGAPCFLCTPHCFASPLLTRLSMSALSVPGGGAHHGFLNFVAGIMGMLFGLLTFALGFITLFLMAQRFQKNLLGDEGYISFTLPVTVSQNIAAKLMVSCVWFFSSFVAEVLAILILTVNARFFLRFFPMMFEVFKDIPESYVPHVVLWIAEGVLLALAGMSVCILMIYASLALGYCFGKRRILMSFAAFLGLLTLSQFAGYPLTRLMNLFSIQAMEPVFAVHAVMLFFLACSLVYSWGLLLYHQVCAHPPPQSGITPGRLPTVCAGAFGDFSPKALLFLRRMPWGR